MSDKELVTINPEQWERLLTDIVALSNAVWGVKDVVAHQTTEITKWQSIQNETIRAGFASVAEAIANLQPLPPPQPEQKGTLVARYKFDEDQAPVTFDLVFKGGTSAKGTPVGAGDVDLSIASSSGQLMAELGPQTLSDDGNEVKATVTLTGQTMPVAELAVVSYAATNRDTGNQVAADTDEFETGPGEVAIGTLDSPVPLTEV